MTERPFSDPDSPAGSPPFRPFCTAQIGTALHHGHVAASSHRSTVIAETAHLDPAARTRDAKRRRAHVSESPVVHARRHSVRTITVPLRDGPFRRTIRVARA